VKTSDGLAFDIRDVAHDPTPRMAFCSLWE